MEGDMQAIKEMADRLDGKVPQAIVGDDEHAGVRIEEIRRTIVDHSGSRPSIDTGHTNGAGEKNSA
jgi:hypothetical protein